MQIQKPVGDVMMMGHNLGCISKHKCLLLPCCIKKKRCSAMNN